MGLVGFPGGASDKEPACQCRRHKRCVFYPWVGKIPWRKAWQPTPVFLPGESHGQRSLVGYSSHGHRVRHDCSDLYTRALGLVCVHVFTAPNLLMYSWTWRDPAPSKRPQALKQYPWIEIPDSCALIIHQHEPRSPTLFLSFPWQDLWGKRGLGLWDIPSFGHDTVSSCLPTFQPLVITHLLAILPKNLGPTQVHSPNPLSPRKSCGSFQIPVCSVWQVRSLQKCCYTLGM